MALDVDREVLLAEDPKQRWKPIFVHRERLDAGQRDQPLDPAFQLVDPNPAFALLDAGLHCGDQLAEAAIARPALDQERQDSPTAQAQLGPDDGPDASLFRSFEEARGPGYRVTVDERQRVQAELRSAGHEILGRRGGAEEREGGRGVKLDGHGAAVPSPYLRS